MPKTITNREALIEKSLEIFQKNGYYHTSFSELAKGCGIEKSHFYYYFKDKKDLMKEVLRYAAQYVQDEVLSLAANETVPAAERLAQILNRFRQIYSNSPTGCFMGNTLLETVDREDAFRDVLVAYFSSFREALRSVYQTKYADEKAGQLAVETLAKIQGTVMLTRLYKDISILDQAFQQIRDDF